MREKIIKEHYSFLHKVRRQASSKGLSGSSLAHGGLLSPGITSLFVLNSWERFTCSRAGLCAVRALPTYRYWFLGYIGSRAQLLVTIWFFLDAICFSWKKLHDHRGRLDPHARSMHIFYKGIVALVTWGKTTFAEISGHLQRCLQSGWPASWLTTVGW